MTRTGLGVCVGGFVLLLAVGCASTDVAGMIGFRSDERVVEGSLDAVAQTTRDRLVQRLKLTAEVNKQGEAVYIHSATPNGVKFTLVLTREKVGQTEQTRIKLQWQDKPDGSLAGYLLASFEDIRAH
jgi:hypothetical protein